MCNSGWLAARIDPQECEVHRDQQVIKVLEVRSRIDVRAAELEGKGADHTALQSVSPAFEGTKFMPFDVELGEIDALDPVFWDVVVKRCDGDFFLVLHVQPDKSQIAL